MLLWSGFLGWVYIIVREMEKVINKCLEEREKLLYLFNKNWFKIVFIGINVYYS